MVNPLLKCAICSQTIFGFGHNGQPVKDGRVCGDCNATLVIPMRLADLHIAVRKRYPSTPKRKRGED